MNLSVITTILLYAALLTACNDTNQASGGEEGSRADPYAVSQSGVRKVVATANVAEADDLDFINRTCHASLADEHSIPPDEKERFCSCITAKVDHDFTTAQKEAVDIAQGLRSNGQSIPPMHFSPSGLRGSIQSAQDECADELWANTDAVSEEDHDKFSDLANRSVDEFHAMLDQKCGTIPSSLADSTCAVEVAQDWLDTRSQDYSSIPELYITGNTLASSLLEDAP